MSSGMVQGTSQKQEKKESTSGSTESARLKLVQRLLAAGDNLPVFLQDLLNTQAMVVAGTEAAAFMVDQSQGEMRLVPVVHMRPDQASDEVRKNAVDAFIQLVMPCIQQNREGAFEVGSPDDAGELQFCLATVLRSDGQPVGVTAVITRCMGMDRARQRLASMELVAGYFELFSIRKSADQAKQVATSHQGVLQLVGALATVDGFESGARNICNELATRTGASRVAMGWVKKRNIKIVAMSHTEKFDKRQELLVQMKKAMEESLDQEQIVHYDPAGGGTETVCREATAYSRENGNCVTVAVPLRRMNEIVGVLFLEYAADKKPDTAAAAIVTITGDSLTPQLYDRYQNDRNIFLKIGGSIEHLAKETVGPKHTLQKLIAGGVVAAAICLVAIRPVYRVSAPFSFATQDRRTIVSPAEGFIESVGKIDGADIRPGMRVKAGQVLATMRTTELVMQLAEAQSRANALQKEADAKRDAGKLAEAMSSLAQRDAAQAQADLLRWKISQAEIKSPIDGEVLRGDLRDRRGAPVKEGDALFEVASLKDLEVEAEVSERDIQLVSQGLRVGEFATNSDPAVSYPFTVTRIVPLGEPKEQANVFKVYGKIDGELKSEWKPGMVGEVRIGTQRASLLWIWTHRLMDFMRLKLWW